MFKKGYIVTGQQRLRKYNARFVVGRVRILDEVPEIKEILENVNLTKVPPWMDDAKSTYVKAMAKVQNIKIGAFRYWCYVAKEMSVLGYHVHPDKLSAHDSKSKTNHLVKRMSTVCLTYIRT